MKKIALLLSLLTLYSCSTLPKREKMVDLVKNYQLPHKPKSGEGIVYVVRPSGLGHLVRFNVFLDKHNPEDEMGWTRSNQHIYFYTSPGKHKIWSVAENNAELEFNVKEGQATIIEQITSMGFIMARNNLKEVKDEIKGKYFVMKSGLGTIKKTRITK